MSEAMEKLKEPIVLSEPVDAETVSDTKLIELARIRGYDLDWLASVLPVLEDRPMDVRVSGLLSGMRYCERTGNLDAWVSSLTRLPEISALKASNSSKLRTEYERSCNALLYAIRVEDKRVRVRCATELLRRNRAPKRRRRLFINFHSAGRPKTAVLAQPPPALQL